MYEPKLYAIYWAIEKLEIQMKLFLIISLFFTSCYSMKWELAPEDPPKKPQVQYLPMESPVDSPEAILVLTNIASSDLKSASASPNPEEKSHVDASIIYKLTSISKIPQKRPEAYSPKPHQFSIDILFELNSMQI